LSSEIAQTLVTIGVDLGKMNTVGELQGGMEEAERLLGYRVVSLSDGSHSACRRGVPDLLACGWLSAR